jgi:arylsulfatase A-like enzyme
MLMTGKYARNTGITTNIMQGLDLALDTAEITFGEVLKSAGYQTAYLGKWHLEQPEVNKKESRALQDVSGWDAYTPPGPYRQGFDFWHAYNVDNDHFDPHYWGNDTIRIEPERWSPDHETDVLLNYLKNRNKEKPFAAFVSWNPPHSPFVAPDTFRLLYDTATMKMRPNVTVPDIKEQQRNYYAAVSSIDYNFGRILTFLEENNLDENTWVVFSSDHGEMMGSHGFIKEKTMWYEESIGIPFLIRGPGLTRTGRDNRLVAVYDFMPTLLGLMGLPIPEDVDGRDLSGEIQLDNYDSTETVLLAHYAYLSGHHELVPDVAYHPVLQQGIQRRKSGYDLDQIGYRAVTDGRFTYVVDRKPVDEPGLSFNWHICDPEMDYPSAPEITRTTFLYDKKKDPYQMHPLDLSKAEHRETVERLEKELASWLSQTNDAFPVN